MSNEILNEGKSISQLPNAQLPLDLEETFFEVEQTNLEEEGKSKRLKLIQLLNKIVTETIEQIELEAKTAAGISYDNEESNLVGEDVQEALNELAETRAKIQDLHSAAFSGDYSELNNLPTLGTAAEKDTGTSPNEIPTNDLFADVAKTGNYEDLNNTPTLGTVAERNIGIDPEEVPLNKDLDFGEIVNYEVGTESNQIPLNFDLGSAAYVNTGTEPNEIPTNDDLPEFGTAAVKNIGNGLNEIPTNEDLLLLEKEVTGDYTLQLEDMNKVIAFDTSLNSFLTIPASSSVNFPIGTMINVYCAGDGDVVIDTAAGVTARNKGFIAKYNEASLRKRKENEWVVIGAIGEE